MSSDPAQPIVSRGDDTPPQPWWLDITRAQARDFRDSCHRRIEAIDRGEQPWDIPIEPDLMDAARKWLQAQADEYNRNLALDLYVADPR